MMAPSDRAAIKSRGQPCSALAAAVSSVSLARYALVGVIYSAWLISGAGFNEKLSHL